MKAVVVHAAEDLRVEDIPAPELDPNEVLVSIVYGGICGSDLHYYQHGRNGSFVVKEPMALGHEVVGRIAAIGSEVEDGFMVGAPVAIHPARPAPWPGDEEGKGLNLHKGGSYLGSASTWPHTQGGFVETLSVQPQQLRLIPDGVPLRRAALAEPLAVALHGVDRAAGHIQGADVLVSGAGPIGCLVVAVLKRRGAKSVTVVDLQAKPLEVARAVGADVTLQIGVDELPEPESFGVIVEAAGVVPSLVSCLGWIARGGHLVQLGILPKGNLEVPLSDLIAREVTYYGCQRFDVEMDEAVEMIATTRSLDAVVTDVFAAEDSVAAFQRAADSSQSSKVLVQLADD